MSISGRELNAAGIQSPHLRASYSACRELNSQHGKTYYLATLLLPQAKRPYVHALYGFARYADDIVDEIGGRSNPERMRALDEFSHGFFRDLRQGHSEHPIYAATIHTAMTWELAPELFEAFLTSMRMDLTTSSYETYEDLRQYMYGSAAVIGLQMLPILEPTGPDAADAACDLGYAFQLANFIRDVGEDLDRDRIYLPLADLAAFDVSAEDLRKRVPTDAIAEALRFQIARVRQLEANSISGIDQLHPTSRPCIDAARRLYCGIVDEVERNQYDVFTKRARVPNRTRLAVAIPAWYAAWRARSAA